MPVLDDDTQRLDSPVRPSIANNLHAAHPRDDETHHITTSTTKPSSSRPKIKPQCLTPPPNFHGEPSVHAKSDFPTRNQPERGTVQQLPVARQPHITPPLHQSSNNPSCSVDAQATPASVDLEAAFRNVINRARPLTPAEYEAALLALQAAAGSAPNVTRPALHMRPLAFNRPKPVQIPISAARVSLNGFPTMDLLMSNSNNVQAISNIPSTYPHRPSTPGGTSTSGIPAFLQPDEVRPSTNTPPGNLRGTEVSPQTNYASNNNADMSRPQMSAPMQVTKEEAFCVQTPLPNQFSGAVGGPSPNNISKSNMMEDNKTPASRLFAPPIAESVVDERDTAVPAVPNAEDMDTENVQPRNGYATPSDIVRMFNNYKSPRESNPPSSYAIALSARKIRRPPLKFSPVDGFTPSSVTTPITKHRRSQQAKKSQKAQKRIGNSQMPDNVCRPFRTDRRRSSGGLLVDFRRNSIARSEYATKYAASGGYQSGKANKPPLPESARQILAGLEKLGERSRAFANIKRPLSPLPLPPSVMRKRARLSGSFTPTRKKERNGRQVNTSREEMQNRRLVAYGCGKRRSQSQSEVAMEKSDGDKNIDAGASDRVGDVNMGRGNESASQSVSERQNLYSNIPFNQVRKLTPAEMNQQGQAEKSTVEKKFNQPKSDVKRLDSQNPTPPIGKFSHRRFHSSSAFVSGQASEKKPVSAKSSPFMGQESRESSFKVTEGDLPSAAQSADPNFFNSSSALSAPPKMSVFVTADASEKSDTAPEFSTYGSKWNSNAGPAPSTGTFRNSNQMPGVVDEITPNRVASSSIPNMKSEAKETDFATAGYQRNVESRHDNPVTLWSKEGKKKELRIHGIRNNGHGDQEPGKYSEKRAGLNSLSNQEEEEYKRSKSVFQVSKATEFPNPQDSATVQGIKPVSESDVAQTNIGFSFQNQSFPAAKTPVLEEAEDAGKARPLEDNAEDKSEQEKVAIKLTEVDKPGDSGTADKNVLFSNKSSAPEQEKDTTNPSTVTQHPEVANEPSFETGLPTGSLASDPFGLAKASQVFQKQPQPSASLPFGSEPTNTIPPTSFLTGENDSEKQVKGTAASPNAMAMSPPRAETTAEGLDTTTGDQANPIGFGKKNPFGLSKPKETVTASPFGGHSFQAQPPGTGFLFSNKTESTSSQPTSGPFGDSKFNSLRPANGGGMFTFGQAPVSNAAEKKIALSKDDETDSECSAQPGNPFSVPNSSGPSIFGVQQSSKKTSSTPHENGLGTGFSATPASAGVLASTAASSAPGFGSGFGTNGGLFGSGQSNKPATQSTLFPLPAFGASVASGPGLGTSSALATPFSASASASGSAFNFPSSGPNFGTQSAPSSNAFGNSSEPSQTPFPSSGNSGIFGPNNNGSTPTGTGIFNSVPNATPGPGAAFNMGTSSTRPQSSRRRLRGRRTLNR